MQKTYWKIFGAGMIAGLLYFIITYNAGVDYVIGVGLGSVLHLRNDFLALVLDILPLILWAGAVFYLYQTIRGWCLFTRPSLKTKIIAALIFGLGPFVLYLIWVCAALVFIRPQIG